MSHYHWLGGFFVAAFILSCLAVVTLQCLTFECTRPTSALTSSVVGVVKAPWETFVCFCK
ncbi:hypothetical protein TSMEX_000379 [Taenia solium]|eukprot:TsM_000350000 transcript=TsM_000350000 gene=TsM_000350000